MRWLNGDPHERISLESEGVRVLGKLEREPGPVRTRREAIFESDILRRHEDISRIERQSRIDDQKKFDMINAALSEVVNFMVEELIAGAYTAGTTEELERIQKWKALNFDLIFDIIFDALTVVTYKVVDEVVMNALISVSSEYIDHIHESEAMKGMKSLANIYRQYRKRRILLNKWRPYISEELPFEVGVSNLKHAARLINKASPYVNRRKLPVSQLVGSAEIELLDKYAPSVTRSHNASVMNEAVSRRIVAAETAVGSALGSALRDSFLDHTALTRTLHFAKTNDQSHVAHVESERDAAISTPCMSPLHAFVHNLAAPSIALKSGAEIRNKRISKSGFEIRKEKLLCLLNNTARALNSPRNIFPVFESVGRDLSTTAPASQLNRIANDWGVSTTHNTALEANEMSGEGYTEAFYNELAALRDDDDIHGNRSTSDNVGKGAAKRVETTTQHHCPMRYSELPATVQGVAKSESLKRWNSMATSGIHKDEDLLCSAKSDELLRMGVIMQIQAIDESVPDSPPNQMGDMSTRAAKLKNKVATLSISETDYKTTVQGEESSDPIAVSKIGVSKSSPFGRGPRLSVWERGNRLHPQIPETFSKDSTLVKLIMRNHKLCHPKSHYEAGDGAPICALLKLQRVALHMLRQERNGQVLNDDETVDLLRAVDIEDERREDIVVSDDDDSDSSRSTINSSSASESNSSAVGVESGECESSGPAYTARRERKPASKLKLDQAKVLCSGMILVLGIWHCMQESIIVNLDANHDDWSHFIPLWRATEGRVNFLLGGGSVRDALHELFSAVAGMVKFLAVRFRSFRCMEEELDYSDLDEFIDEEAERSTVFARLRSLIELTILTKLLHDSMRQGMLSHVWLLLKQVAELCAATRKFKYMRLITELRVLIATMPLADLLFLLDMTFTDMGSYFAPTDEFTEVIHWLYEKLVGRRRERGWVASITRLSTTLSSQEPGRNLGTSSGAHLPPSGFREVDMFIVSRVQQHLHTVIQDDGWVDKDGTLHPHDEIYGFGGPLPLHAKDSQRVGRAILKDDVSKIIFGGKSASSVSRSNPVRMTLTAAAESKRRENREKQISASTSVDIEKTSYTKLGMTQDIALYAAFTPRSQAVAVVINGTDKQLFIPRASASRPQLAAALSRWRTLDRQHCSMAHDSSAADLTDLDRRITQQPSTSSRRAAARASLRAQGMLNGLTMTRNKQIPTNSTKTDVPPVQLLASWLESNRNIPAASTGQGETGMKKALEYVSASKACVDEGEDCASFVQSLKCSVKKLNNCASAKRYVGGREQQMQAARTFRRVAEIEALSEERQRRINLVVPSSPWSDGSLEPPAVSMGNAVNWQPPATGNGRPMHLASETQHGEGVIPSVVTLPPTRRPPVCSCCSQIRSLGHVRIRLHSNKTCSRCRLDSTTPSDP